MLTLEALCAGAGAAALAYVVEFAAVPGQLFGWAAPLLRWFAQHRWAWVRALGKPLGNCPTCQATWLGGGLAAGLGLPFLLWPVAAAVAAVTKERLLS